MEKEKNINTFKHLAREAKRRLKSGYWDEFDRRLQNKIDDARMEGSNPSKVKEYYINRQLKEVSGKKNEDEEFYLRVKTLLLEYGEVSDAIGRLIDKDLYEGMDYEQRQRYTLELSNKYVEALERFRKEKEYGCVNES